MWWIGCPLKFNIPRRRNPTGLLAKMWVHLLWGVVAESRTNYITCSRLLLGEPYTTPYNADDLPLCIPLTGAQARARPPPPGLGLGLRLGSGLAYGFTSTRLGLKMSLT